MPKFPLTIGKKPNHSTIYQTSSGKFSVKWKQAGKWKTTTKATLKDAQNFAKAISDKKKVDALPASIPKQSEVQMLNDIQAQTKRLGVTVTSAFEEYKNAKQILPEGYSLVDAAKALKEKISRPDIRVPELVQEFYSWKEKSGNIDPKYLRHIQAFKNKITSKLSINISALTPKLAQEFIDDLNYAVSTKNHYVATFRAFINYGIDHGYLPSDTRLLNTLKTQKKTEAVDNLMSPERFCEVYREADDIIKARYFLVAFVGLRVGEACKWTIKDLTDNCVVVSASIAKKSARRTIEVSSDIVDWLRANVDKFKIGEALSEKKFTYYNKKVMKVNSKNVLRHSGISYKLALSADVNQTAHDFGTSPAKINSNYKELTTKKEAEKWFNLASEIIKNKF